MSEDIKNSIDFLTMICENENHDYFASLFNENNNNYVYSEKLDLWYEYDIYNKLTGGTKKPPISLTYTITKDLQQLIKLQYKKITDIIPVNKVDQKDTINLIKQIMKIYNKLGNTTYIKDIIEKLKYYCKVDKLDELIDNNKYLICFNNVVYDFKINKYRKILKSDYCYNNTGYDKPEINKKIQDTIKNILYSCFDNDEIYKFLLDSLALSLLCNDNNKFYIWTGKGGNGKGLLNTLLNTALGNYFYQTSQTFITSEHMDDRPNSNLYNLKGKRYCMISEPSGINGKLKFNLSFLKLITSNNDKINVRKLYSEPIEYTPLFTPILQCNLIPDLGSIGDAEIRRICILHFPFSFKKNPNKNNLFEKRVNLNYSTLVKQIEYGAQFILMLIENLYELYHPNKMEDFNYNKIVEISIPTTISKYTMEYLNDNDIILSYIDEYIDITNNKKDYIKKTDLFNHFKNITNDKEVSNKMFYQRLNNDGFIEYKTGGIRFYSGIKIKDINDNSDSDDSEDIDEINNKSKYLNV
jgi:hypothetical protein